MLIAVVCLVLVFIFFFCIIPKEASIYFEGMVDSLRLKTVNNSAFYLEFRSSKSDARIRFTSDTELQMVNRELLLHQRIDEIDPETTLLFDDDATLMTNATFTIRLEMQDRSSFPCQIEAYNGSDPFNLTGQMQTLCADNESNLILLHSFPENITITLFSASEINARGDVDEGAAMPAGEYQILNADSIQIPVLSSSQDKMIFEITDFSINSHEKNTLEISQNSRTEFRDMGHVNMSGRAKGKSLGIQLKDLGNYPFTVIISGHVGPLEIAGESCYLTLPQWLTENMTEILSILLGAILGALFTTK